MIRTKYSVQFKFTASFAGLLAGLLILLNIYPIVTYRELVFKSKQNVMQNQGYVMSASLALTVMLAPDTVSQVMELLDVMPLSRVVVADEQGAILYDTAETVPDGEQDDLPSEIERALEGKLVFYSSFRGGAFASKAAVPIRSSGVTIGCVYLYEYDTEQAAYLTGIHSGLIGFTLIVSFVAVALIYIFTKALTKRITDLAHAVKRAGDGDYGYRIAVSGNDELTELGSEFNTLTGRLQQTEEARRRFVSDASHELKTPLASIRLLSDSILQSENMDVLMMREFVFDIRNESERLERTAEKLLNLTRLDREEIQISRELVDVGKVAAGTLQLISPLANQGGVTLESEISGDTVIYAAEDDIYQIIFNLVENAIKYNVEGGRVKLSVRRMGDRVVLCADDTGIGIPEEDRPHVFSRFYRVDKARSREAGGSGLGLSIVYDAVKLHGGTVEIEDLEPNGTRFRVEFPSPKSDI